MDRLPVEIIASILDLAVEANRLDYSKTRASTPYNDLAYQDYPHHTLLAPIQISSRLRNIAIRYPPLWRSVAAMVSASGPHRPHARSTSLLSLCAKLSGDKLTSLDLTSFVWTNQYMLTVLSAAVQSARSLEELHLPRVPDFSVNHCQCPECIRMWRPSHGKRAPSQQQAAQLSNAVFDIVVKATSLLTLSLHLNWLPTHEDLLRYEEQVVARPSTLRLTVWTEGSLPRPLLELLRKLSSKATSLHLDFATDRQYFPGEPTGWTSWLIEPISSNLRLARLFGPPSLLDLTSFFRCQWPVLETLSISTVPLGDDGLTVMGTAALFPSLNALEVPVDLLDFVDAPNVRQLAVNDLHERNEDVMIGELENYSKVEDLVLHSQTLVYPPGRAPVFTQSIRSLTPSSINTDMLCPALRRLSLSRQDTWSSDWILDGAFKDPATCHSTRTLKRSTFAVKEQPVLGTDLFRLLRNRNELASHNDLGTSGSATVARCNSLKTIRIIDCLAEPSTWICALKLGDCQHMWCLPDPLDSKQQVMIDGSVQERLKQVNEARDLLASRYWYRIGRED